MRQRLVQTTFRQHLISFADQDNQVELSRKLENALFEHDASTRKPKNKPELHFKRTRLAFPIWQVLYRDHKRRVKATARAIAVPTADADAKARKERLQHWLDAGMNVLNVAAFFVPGLDAAMLGVFAYDLMDSVFTGFEAWEEGDTQEALQQLESLAINAAVIAGFAVGSKALKASGFVDALESVWKGGRERLWHPDMGPYSTSSSLPVGVQKNAQGLYIIDGKTHVWLQGKLYEVFETDGQWHVRHPDAPMPTLRPCATSATSVGSWPTTTRSNGMMHSCSRGWAGSARAGCIGATCRIAHYRSRRRHLASQPGHRLAAAGSAGRYLAAPATG